MDKTQYIELIPIVLYLASEIIGLNPKWKANSTIQAVINIASVLSSMFLGKKVVVGDSVKTDTDVRMYGGKA